MTVAELIEALKECPPDMKVKAHFCGEEYAPDEVDLVRVKEIDDFYPYGSHVELLK